jgi:hypothetical protein
MAEIKKYMLAVKTPGAHVDSRSPEPFSSGRRAKGLFTDLRLKHLGLQNAKILPSHHHTKEISTSANSTQLSNAL